MNRCMCGCGELVSARFVAGHNGRLMHTLYTADRRGLLVTIYDRVSLPGFYAAEVGPRFMNYFLELVGEDSR